MGRYYRHRATDAERYIIDRWYQSFDSDHHDLSWLEDKQHLEEIERKIIAKALHRPQPISWYRKPWVSIAASIFLVALVTVCFYFISGKNIPQSEGHLAPKTVITGSRQIKRIVLTDSTEVFLNANSSLEIAGDFGQEGRLVKLAGEAYFNVKRDTLLPFVVSTSRLDIQVLGTAFNVLSYETVGNIRIAVSEGKVQVSDLGQTLAVLQADEQGIYHKATRAFKKSSVAPAKFSSWTNGTLVLDTASFDELAQAIYNMYGMKLKSSDKGVLENKYNFTLRTTRTVEQVMEQFCAMINKHYRKEGTAEIIVY